MDEQLKAYIGGRIKTYRKAKGLTQAELAAKIERSDEAISNLERGKSLPEVPTLVAVAKELERPVQDFLPSQSSYQNKSPSRLSNEAELSSLVSGMSDHQLGIAIEQLKALSNL